MPDWIEVNGAALRYDLQGQGASTLVLIHEMGGTLESWNDVLPPLTLRRRVLRYDTRGAGLSEKVRGPLSIDLKRMIVRWDGKPIELTLTELWMVHALARYPGHVKDRDALMRDASIVVDDGTITSHIKRIRRKFQASDPQFDAIETVYGMGYRWTEGG